jgi:DNA-binding NarL/FixJ family response regulator
LSAIKVVIIDDNKAIRRIVQEVLSMEKDFAFCGEADSIGAAQVLLFAQQPDVAIIDISLNEEGGGFRLLKDMRVANLPTKAIMFSAYPAEIYSQKSLESGAKGYLCKEHAVESLGEAIRCVHSGGIFISADRESSRHLVSP